MLHKYKYAQTVTERLLAILQVTRPANSSTQPRPMLTPIRGFFNLFAKSRNCSWDFISSGNCVYVSNQIIGNIMVGTFSNKVIPGISRSNRLICILIVTSRGTPGSGIKVRWDEWSASFGFKSESSWNMSSRIGSA